MKTLAMPFPQPGRTAAVVGGRFSIITDVMLRVLKIFCQDHVPYYSLVLVLNEGIQFSAAYMHPDYPPHTHAHAWNLCKPVISRKFMKRIFKSIRKLSETVDE